jgi:hypothetical protein
VRRQIGSEASDERVDVVDQVRLPRVHAEAGPQAPRGGAGGQHRRPVRLLRRLRDAGVSPVRRRERVTVRVEDESCGELRRQLVQLRRDVVVIVVEQQWRTARARDFEGREGARHAHRRCELGH